MKNVIFFLVLIPFLVSAQTEIQLPKLVKPTGMQGQVKTNYLIPVDSLVIISASSFTNGLSVKGAITTSSYTLIPTDLRGAWDYRPVIDTVDRGWVVKNSELKEQNTHNFKQLSTTETYLLCESTYDFIERIFSKRVDSYDLFTVLDSMNYPVTWYGMTQDVEGVPTKYYTFSIEQIREIYKNLK